MSVEASLETHLEETRTALEEITQCLLEKDDDEDESDATESLELIKLRDELECSLRETEKALLQLKKERLLEEVRKHQVYWQSYDLAMEHSVLRMAKKKSWMKSPVKWSIHRWIARGMPCRSVICLPIMVFV